MNERRKNQTKTEKKKMNKCPLKVLNLIVKKSGQSGEKNSKKNNKEKI